ncbi:PREDICTED: putative ubiquitin-conjugating enzyme E2 38 [Fragaria vesca subsp. vesca]|uniref:putative ubiquitin-conjugating enzyme E2 38 n=1 Tax=Fragaria vesca subsp. vesca TaxID=101020 RepID=UPI0002C3369C|nr:PREDICTED: putative ubiquitin-conjugating enzyme E2 38 [Fragaria vesca subsp. vesca]
MTQNGDAPTPFPRFDVVPDHSDHAYAAVSSKKQNYDGSVHKTIMKEWRVLENNLPDSIFVRVYDTRIELLRAVIVGAAGTPYHDALFFFDIKFPPDYPTRPPIVHYRSYGLRVNPNLYASGYVCLSLLNTWIGKKREKWDPAQSTVLQVLLSIQALVLNEKPYFNEPGTGSPGGSGVEKRSRAYNEDAFVLTCKTTLYSLRNPPRNFEAFTAVFFRERGSRILRACGAYVNARVGVGCYRDEGELETSTQKPRVVWDVSKKFKASMQELYPQLVQVFKKNGALDLVEVLEVEAKTTPVKVEAKTKTVKVRVDKKAKIGIAKKVIGKLRKFLGLSKKKNQKMEKSDEKKDVNAGVAVGC